MARIQIEGIEMTFDFNIQNAITNSKKIQAQLKQTFSKIKNDASSNDAQKELTNTQKIMQRNFKLVRDAKKRMAQTMNQKESTLTSKKSNIRIGGMSAEEYKAKIDAQANSMVNSAKNAHARVQQVQNKAMGESAFGQAARKYSEASNKSWQNFNQVEMYKEPIGPQLPQKKEPLQYFGSSGAPPNDSSKTPNKFNLGVLQQMQSSMFKTMGIGTKLGAILGGIGSRFTRGARNMTPGTSMMQKGLGNVGNSVDRVISRIVSLAKRIFFFTMIAKGFRMIRESIGSYLATDKQFSNSLNQVRVNLLTAFYPIYTTILPYINMFMTGLANVTGQLAAFLSMLTGTTFAASKAGAQALKQQAAEMDKTSEKAKKLQQQLMGFDEINTLSFDDSSDNQADSPSGADFGAAMGDYTTPEWLRNFWADIVSIAKDFAQPFIDAWNNKGAALIAAIKYAFTQIWELIKAIGRSFMEVWTNGTGQKFIENILQLWTEIFNIMGDIGRALRNAWEEGNRGTVMIQTIFNALNRILELLHTLAATFRNVWNNGTGEAIFANILTIITNIARAFENLAQGIKIAWEANGNGERIMQALLGIVQDVTGWIGRLTGKFADFIGKLNFEPLLNAGAKAWEGLRTLIQGVLDVGMMLYEEFIQPFAKWMIEFVLPKGLSMMGSVFEGIGKALSVISKNKVAVEVIKSLAIAIGIFVGVLKVANIAIGIFNAVLALNPIVLIIAGVIALIAAIVLLVRNWDEVKVALGKAWDWLKGKFGELKDWFVQKIQDLLAWFKELPSKFGDVIDSIAEWFRSLPEKIKQATVVLANGIFEFIFGKKVSASDGSTATSYTQDIANFFKDLPQKIKTAIGNIWAAIKEPFTFRATQVTDAAKQLWESFKDTVSNLKKAILGGNAGHVWQLIVGLFTFDRAKVTDSIKQLWQSFDSVVTSVIRAIFGQSGVTMWDKLKNLFVIGKDRVLSGVSGLWSWASDVWPNIQRALGNVREWIIAKFDIGHGIGKNIYNGVISILNSMIDGLNSLFGSLNKILNKVGIGSVTIPRLSYWYADGTDYHPGGLAVVNDGTGAWQEAFKVPGSAWQMFPAVRNLVTNLPRGTQVLSGSQTKNAFPNYATGTGLSMPTLITDMLNETQTSTRTTHLPSVSNDNQGAMLSVLNAILQALVSGQATREKNGDIIINIGGQKLVRILGSEIAKFERQTGRSFITV